MLSLMIHVCFIAKKIAHHFALKELKNWRIEVEDARRPCTVLCAYVCVYVYLLCAFDEIFCVMKNPLTHSTQPEKI